MICTQIAKGAIPFPYSEIYYYVLVEGWKIRELWRKNGEIKLCAYCPDPLTEQVMAKMGADFETIKERLKHLEFSIYED